MTSSQDKHIAVPAGIAIQSSTPLYAKRQYGTKQNKLVQSPQHSEHDHHAPIYQQQSPGEPLNNQPNYDNHNHNYIPSHDQHLQETHAQTDHDHNRAHDHSFAHHDHNHAHDHSHHDHSHHDHGHHDHNHHDSGHHDHSHHDHNHHDHSHQHAHNFTPVYTEPLPSWFQIFSRLAPAQKTMFTWFLIHSGIGVWLYIMGINRESLSLVGFSYLMFFDALGVLNLFVSSFVRTIPGFGVSNTKRPYGAHRYEIIFALGTTIYLMFATMHNTKESLEHFLLENHHGGEKNEENHLKFSLGMFLMIGSAISATCLSSIALRNHDNFVRYLKKRTTTVQGFSYNVINRARGNPIHALLSNIYSSSIVFCGAFILLMYMFGLATPFTDKTFALVESVVMFYLGFPTAKGLAKILLQTTPQSIQNGVENRLREILQDRQIINVDKVHFWQTTYGKCVGTIEIQVHPDADEQAVLQLVYHKLEGLTSSSLNYDDHQSELTVSIYK